MQIAEIFEIEAHQGLSVKESYVQQEQLHDHPGGPGLGAAPQSRKALWFCKMSSTVPELHDSTRAHRLA